VSDPLVPVILPRERAVSDFLPGDAGKYSSLKSESVIKPRSLADATRRRIESRGSGMGVDITLAGSSFWTSSSEDRFEDGAFRSASGLPKDATS